MTAIEIDNPLRTEEGVFAAMDAIHLIFTELRNNALDLAKSGGKYDAEFVARFADWVEVLPTYLHRSDADAVEDFRNGLEAIAKMHPIFRNVRRRFDDRMGYTHPLPTLEDVEVRVNGMATGKKK